MSSQPPAHKWTLEHKDLLRGLWDDDTLTCAQITEILNKTFDITLTKNAIIGRAHRMELRRKESPIKKVPLEFDRLKFIQMWNSGTSNAEMIAAFGLHTAEQVRYRAEKLGLKKRKAKRSAPRHDDHRRREHIHSMLPADDPGMPTQIYERVNNWSKKWFESNTPCGLQPCMHAAVPGGWTCYNHGSSHAR